MHPVLAPLGFGHPLQGQARPVLVAGEDGGAAGPCEIAPAAS
jgi:hypothetical protein